MSLFDAIEALDKEGVMNLLATPDVDVMDVNEEGINALQFAEQLYKDLVFNRRIDRVPMDLKRRVWVERQGSAVAEEGLVAAGRDITTIREILQPVEFGKNQCKRFYFYPPPKVGMRSGSRQARHIRDTYRDKLYGDYIQLLIALQLLAFAYGEQIGDYTNPDILGKIATQLSQLEVDDTVMDRAIQTRQLKDPYYRLEDRKQEMDPSYKEVADKCSLRRLSRESSHPLFEPEPEPDWESEPEPEPDWEPEPEPDWEPEPEPVRCPLVGGKKSNKKRSKKRSKKSKKRSKKSKKRSKNTV